MKEVGVGDARSFSLGNYLVKSYNKENNLVIVQLLFGNKRSVRWDYRTMYSDKLVGRNFKWNYQ